MRSNFLLALLLPGLAGEAASVSPTAHPAAPNHYTAPSPGAHGAAEELEEALAECIGFEPGVSVLQVGQELCIPPYVPACANVVQAGHSECQLYNVQGGDTVARWVQCTGYMNTYRQGKELG